MLPVPVIFGHQPPHSCPVRSMMCPQPPWSPFLRGWSWTAPDRRDTTEYKLWNITFIFKHSLDINNLNHVFLRKDAWFAVSSSKKQSWKSHLNITKTCEVQYPEGAAMFVNDKGKKFLVIQLQRCPIFKIPSSLLFIFFSKNQTQKLQISLKRTHINTEITVKTKIAN